jgi:hypothetical protein
VWHSGTLKKVFLGEVLVPLEGWMFEESNTQGSSWYPLCPKVGYNGGSLSNVHKIPFDISINKCI